MYEDVESAVAYTGGTLALTGTVVHIEWLVAAALLLIIAGIGALRLAKR